MASAEGSESTSVSIATGYEVSGWMRMSILRLCPSGDYSGALGDDCVLVFSPADSTVAECLCEVEVESCFVEGLVRRGLRESWSWSVVCAGVRDGSGQVCARLATLTVSRIVGPRVGDGDVGDSG